MILDLQRRIQEIGRIRLGQQVPHGKTSRPAKLDTFRLTSANGPVIEAAAKLYGGEARPWKAPAGPQWEVITKTASLEVIVPPSDMAFSQYFELWSAGGCQRRCDGQNESLSEGPCLCDPNARECDIHTRLSVMLTDLPGLGVWRVDTQGYYAAVELQGAVHIIQLAAGRGTMLPARLRLEQRMVKRQTKDDEGHGVTETRRFVVPVLDIAATPGQLILEGRPTSNGEFDATPGTEMPNLTPVPALPQFPVSSIADQMATVDQEPQRKPNKVGAKPLPATGIRPRTAEEANSETPPWEADGITQKQLNMMGALMKEQQLTERQAALDYVAKVIGRSIDSRKDLTKAEASKVIDALQDDGQAMIAALKAEKQELAGKPT